MKYLSGNDEEILSAATSSDNICEPLVDSTPDFGCGYSNHWVTQIKKSHSLGIGLASTSLLPLFLKWPIETLNAARRSLLLYLLISFSVFCCSNENSSRNACDIYLDMCEKFKSCVSRSLHHSRFTLYCSTSKLCSLILYSTGTWCNAMVLSVITTLWVLPRDRLKTAQYPWQKDANFIRE